MSRSVMTLPSRLGRRAAVFRGTATESVGSRNSSAAMERSSLSGPDVLSLLALALARPKCSARGAGSGTEDAIEGGRLDLSLEPDAPEAAPRLGKGELAHVGRLAPDEAPEDVQHLGGLGRRRGGRGRAAIGEHGVVERHHERQGARLVADLDGPLDPLVE